MEKAGLYVIRFYFNNLNSEVEEYNEEDAINIFFVENHSTLVNGIERAIKYFDKYNEGKHFTRIEVTSAGGDIV